MKHNKALSLLFTFLLISISITAFGQDCGDGPGLPGVDVDAATNQCPLDTWVILLVGAALIFTTFQFYRKQQLEKAI
ncbi:hypothetical protein GCM10027049_23990 [Mucilaginibacter puniceus]